MRKVIICAVLLAGMAGYVTLSSPVTLAQGAKKDKDTKKGKGGPGTIEIAEGKDGKFRFTIRNGDGKFLALSAAFGTEKEANKAIEELKDILPKAKVSKKVKDSK